jgi:hypothetical protein
MFGVFGIGPLEIIILAACGGFVVVGAIVAVVLLATGKKDGPERRDD